TTARTAPAGAVTELPVRSGGREGGMAITAGPDVNLSFTNCRFASESSGPTTVGKVTPDGAITEFLLPSGTYPGGITAGPDGNLWFTEQGPNKIARITTAGVITEYLVPTGGSDPFDITLGPDGNVW